MKSLTIEGRKLSIKEAAEIKELANHGVTGEEVAKWYGVTQGTISSIWNEKTWKGCTEYKDLF